MNKLQIKRKQAGLCISCGKKLCSRSTIYCEFHRVKHNNDNSNSYHRTHNRRTHKTELQKIIDDADKIMKDGMDLDDDNYNETDVDYSPLSSEFVEDCDE